MSACRMRVDNLPFLACLGAQSGRLSTLVIGQSLGVPIVLSTVGATPGRAPGRASRRISP